MDTYKHFGIFLTRSCAIIFTLLISACDTVAFYEKQRLNDPAMQFDSDPLASQMRQHMLTPREGAIGGFAAIGAGGCSCK